MKTPAPEMSPREEEKHTELEISNILQLPQITHHEKKKHLHKKPVTFPTNINEYRHIIDTHKVKDNDLSWILFLRRNQPSNNYFILKNRPIKPPSFYDEDLSSYKKKHGDKSKEYRGNINEIHHLLYKRVGATPNITQTMYETSLRPVHSKDMWKGIPFTPRTILTPDSTIPRHLYKTNLSETSWRKYEPKFEVRFYLFI
jgi:hypothetical protein